MDTQAQRGRPAIAQLPELVKNQIAAGEVIERPASVVKELVENALDAGASRIHLDLEEGGVQLVRIVDDGGGIPPEEIPLAFASHATSKLSQVADLDHIATLGFRGEALASIASVARCRLFSRQRGALLGAAVEIEGGALGEVRESGGPEGTRIEVRDLFYNTPARRRFLKTTATELGRCLDIVQRLALAQPGVGFVVTHDGRRAFEVEPSMDLRARVRRTFGAELADALVPVEAADGDTRLSGFVAPPRFSRNDTTRQMWFLNGRPLRDRILSRVLKDAYRGFVVDGRQTVAFLSLAMDPARVDVNVHPAKAEVRFRDERRVFGFLVGSLRAAVQSMDLATPGERLIERLEQRGELTPRQATLPAPAWEREPRPVPSFRDEAPRALPVFVREAPAAPSAPVAPTEGAQKPEEIRGPLLQVGRTYILRAVDDGFEIVDQHALHERLTLELLKDELARGGIEVQRRLVPELVEVGGAAAQLIEPHLESLARIGLVLARFGTGTIAVQGVPARFRHPDPSTLVHEVIAAIERSGSTPGAEELLEEILHRTACRSSVMAGDELSEIEMRALLARARGNDSSQTCAHGRPTRVRFTLADLERAFYRR
ncbi:MAG: DNA mismatch repair endonuclease MutL [Planctomycetota bacterium]|nr:DNA mismatch repair endonuclease MutL [Planctomycetota bacterium]